MTEIKADENTLATYTYRSGNGKLLNVEYGNGDIEEYIYDVLDRLVSVQYNDVVTYTLIYNANGAIAKCFDNKSGITHEYEYDSLNRLIRAWQKNTSTGVKTLAVENIYDVYGRPDKTSYTVNGKTLDYDLTYDTDSSLISRILMPQSSVQSAINYTYDGFDRLTTKNISVATYHDIYEEYDYYGYSSNGTQYTTGLVSSLTFKTDNATTATYTYTYDSVGNITQIRKNGTIESIYEYDSLGQLIREYNGTNGTTAIFDYDKAGNITHKYLFNGYGPDAYPGIIMACYPVNLVSEGTYSYSNSSWGDLLTGYNGTNIAYNAIGNPSNWRNASSLSWDGRSLTGITLNNGNSASYVYNSDGIRVRKTCGGSTHKYVLDGSTIISETVTGNQNYTLYYLYDASGSIQGFIYNDNYYYFQKNLQGDVLRILNASGVTVVQYAYDAWGKIISTTGSATSTIGAINPFRYRGYYYDTETGFYYLNSRYYDPEVGRFLNADSIIGANDGIQGYNLFAYCNNNPIMYADPSGEMSICSLIIETILKIFGNVIRSTSLYAQISSYVSNSADAFALVKMILEQRNSGYNDTIFVAYDPQGPNESHTVNYSGNLMIFDGYQCVGSFGLSTVPMCYNTNAYDSHGKYPATILNGVYCFQDSKKYTDNTRCARIYTLDGSGVIPCVRWNGSNFVQDNYGATGILIHSGGSGQSGGNPWSKGCFLISHLKSNGQHISEWNRFLNALDTYGSGRIIVYGRNRY